MLLIEAYRRLADEKGMLPREVQSIVWDAWQATTLGKGNKVRQAQMKDYLRRLELPESNPEHITLDYFQTVVLPHLVQGDDL